MYAKKLFHRYVVAGFALMCLCIFLYPRKMTRLAPIAAVHAPKRSQGCKPRVVSMDSPHVRTAYGKQPRVECEKLYPQVIDVDGEGRIRYAREGVECTGRVIRRFPGEVVKTFDVGKLKNGQMLPDQYLTVDCDGQKTALAHIFRNESLVTERKMRRKNAKTGLNVVMIGFDSTSRSAARYTLPKTFDFFENNMHGTVLNHYGIVGDGTPQALIPMFTGKTELELPLARRENWFGPYLDEVYPFVQFEYQKHGYITAYIERMTKYGAWNYRLNGFKNPFTDIYTFPFYLKTEKNYDDFCFRNQTEAGYNLALAKQILAGYHDVPKFMFLFAQATHAKVESLHHNDDEYLAFLKLIYNSELANNTVVILVADHGPRYSRLRATYEGRLEERNPIFAIALPSLLRKANPYAVSNLKKNSFRLATPFDVHATLRDILYGIPTASAENTLNQRGISFFHEIPENRTCASAGIAPHWCTCSDEYVLNVTHPTAILASKTVLTKINSLTIQIRNLCTELTLKSIKYVILSRPTDALLQFSGNIDHAGFEYGFNDNIAPTDQYVQITVELEPGGGVYEATVHLTPDPESQSGFGAPTVSENSISITSRYGDHPHCIIKDYPNLRQFCVCHDMVKAS